MEARNMKKKLLGIFVCMLLIAFTVFTVSGTIGKSTINMINDYANIVSINPPEQWNKTFGGSSYDGGFSGQQTDDGGYIIAGYTYSYGAGSSDVWLIKTDSIGNKIWDNTFGGVNNDVGNSVQQTTDSGYIILGTTNSFGNHEFWLIKTDAYGNEEWNETFVGGYESYAGSVDQTLDGGYILTGYGLSKIPSDHYYLCLIKTDSNGNLVWSKTFGGFPGNAYGHSVQQTIPDEGYIITGAIYSDSDSGAWLIKTDSNGNEIWNKTFGYGQSANEGYSVQQTLDGGYFITGGTFSYQSNADVLLVKTDSNGNEIWMSKFGGDNHDCGLSGQQTTDGKYIVTGYTESYGAGGADVWLIITNSNGNELDSTTFGGLNDDWGWSIDETTDNGCIIIGHTESYGAGGSDVWLIKVSGENNPPFPPSITGTINGQAGKEYYYTFSTTDPEGDDVYYYIEWGDGDKEEWIGPYESGEEEIRSHTWSKTGAYTIRAQAKDIYEAKSGWTILKITMPMNKALNMNLLFLRFLQQHPHLFPILRHVLGL